jgi:RNA polymerase sigma-70 factor (ECF subfamily)
VVDAADQPSRGLASFQGFVRSQLKRFGVSSIDLEDLSQEVWLVALARSPRFDDERATKAWLTQVCRRVAAGDRRTRARTPLLREESTGDLPVEPNQAQQVESDLDEQESLAALAQLSEGQLDVLALYGSGELSMREVAELVGDPEPTVYSRYRTAIDSVSKELRRTRRLGPRTSTAPPAPRRSSLPPAVVGDRERAADLGEFILYRADAQLVVGRVGNVIVAHWRKRIYVQSAEEVGAAIRGAYERLQMPLVLVNVGAPDLTLPDAAERTSLRHNIFDTARNIVMAVDIVDGAPIRRLLAAIVTGLLVVTRANQHLSFALVPSLEASRRLIEPHVRSIDGPLPWDVIANAVHRVRNTRSLKH